MSIQNNGNFTGSFQSPSQSKGGSSLGARGSRSSSAEAELGFTLIKKPFPTISITRVAGQPRKARDHGRGGRTCPPHPAGRLQQRSLCRYQVTGTSASFRSHSCAAGSSQCKSSHGSTSHNSFANEVLHLPSKILHPPRQFDLP